MSNKEDQKEQFVELRAQVLSFDAIAKRINVSRRDLSDILLNIDLRE